MRLKTILTCAFLGAALTGAAAQEHLKSLDAKGIDTSISPKKTFTIT